MSTDLPVAGDNPPVARLHALTSLRFVAASMVFFQHAASHGALLPVVAPVWALVIGQAGVTFFFALSGFILTWCYHRVVARPTLRSIGRFYIARIARIYPIYMLTLVIGVMLGYRAFAGHPELMAVAVGLTSMLLQAWWPIAGEASVVFAFNSPAWTLSVEAFFYLLFPLVAWFVLAVWRPRARGAWLGIGTLVAATWFVAWSVRDLPGPNYFVTEFPPMQLPVFVCGVLVAAPLVLHVPAIAASGVRALTATAAWTMAELLVIGVFVVSLWAAGWVTATLNGGSLFMPAAVFAVFVFARHRGLVSRLLAVGPLVFLGEASYAFYLLHVLVITYATRVLGLELTVPRQPLWAGMYLVTLALACLLFVAVERPLRARVRRRLGARFDRWLDRHEAQQQ